MNLFNIISSAVSAVAEASAEYKSAKNQVRHSSGNVSPMLLDQRIVTITQPYPYYDDNTRHRGIDIKGKLGEKTRAITSGKVAYINKGSSAWGDSSQVWVKCSLTGNTVMYKHCFPEVAVGQRITECDVLGYLDKSGRWAGQHLHFEVHDKSGDICPVQYLHEVQPRLMFVVSRDAVAKVFKKHNPKAWAIIAGTEL